MQHSVLALGCLQWQHGYAECMQVSHLRKGFVQHDVLALHYAPGLQLGVQGQVVGVHHQVLVPCAHEQAAQGPLRRGAACCQPAHHLQPTARNG